MKKLLFSLALVLLLIPAVALAAQFKSSDTGTVGVGVGEQAKNLYISGQTVLVDGNISRDLFVAGSTVTVNGNTEDSLFAAGSIVVIRGDVGGNLRVAGSDITTSGKVDGDALFAGNSVTILKGAIINGDLLAASATLDISGSVDGNVTATASIVTISGKINGNVNLKNVTSLIVNSNTVIAGKLTYSSPNQANIDHDAVITGGVDYQNVQGSANDFSSFGIGAAFSLTKILGMFLCLLLLIYLLPKFSQSFVKEAYGKFWSNLGLGFLVLMIVPIAFIILLALIATAGIAFTALFIYIVMLILAGTMGALLIGSGLYSLLILKKEKEFRIDWLTALIGVLVVPVLLSTPVLGFIIIFSFFLTSLGTLARFAGTFIKNNQK